MTQPAQSTISTPPTTSALAALFTTVGRKQMMAIAGLGLSLFVLTHAMGNMLLFKSPEAYNQYSHALTSNPLIYLAEAGLIFIFLLHTFQGITLSLRNRRARKNKFAVAASGAKATPLNKKLLLIQGIIIFLFVVIHLITFKFGPEYEVEYNGVKMRDLFKLVYEVFQSPLEASWYIVAVTILCFHLAHGFYASLQSLGLQHPRYTPAIKMASVGYGVLVSAMFAAQPIYMLCFYNK